MTERHNEQLPSQQPGQVPLTIDELRLALQEWEKDDLNEIAKKQRRREALKQLLGEGNSSLDGSTSHPIMSTPYVRTAPESSSGVLPVEDAPKVISRNMTVDGKPVHLAARLNDELRRQYIKSEEDMGRVVEYEEISPEDDVTAFRGSDQEELTTLLASDGVEAKVNMSQSKSLREQMGIEDDAEPLPLESNKFGILRNRKVVRVGALALVGVAVAGAATLLPKTGEGGNDTAAAIAVPDEVKAPVEKEIDVQALISDCADGEIGAPVASGVVSVSAGVAWNIPGGTEVFPKLNLGAWDHDSNPATAPVNEPQHLPLTASNVNLSIAVCDTKDKPAVTLENETLHVNLAEVTPQVAFEANDKDKPELSALKQEDLNKLVAKKWFDQNAATELRKNMTDPKMAVAAAKEALHGVIEQMKQKDNKTGVAAITALKQQLQAAIAKRLPAKTDGKPFEVILDGELTNDRIQGVGVDVVANKAFTIDTPRIVAEKINEPTSKAK